MSRSIRRWSKRRAATKPPDLDNPYMGLPVQHFPQALGSPPTAEGEKTSSPSRPSSRRAPRSPYR